MITTTRARTAALTLAAVVALTFAGAGAAQAEPPSMPAIPLNNEQETTGATGGASGFFSYEIDGDQFCYTLEVDGLTAPATAAHIHFAPRNVAGDVVIPLAVPSGTTFEVDACTTAGETLLAEITENPRNYYVNVHTSTFPGGEVRGQLK
ncbi:CHRD domain-containing protein [Agromyces sp. ISL-38]|uniref:CHRD domain-containing protein n=1 Tax=Agromyces sp. ISL-38 TaxID=2819107 RepID=UPI001BEB1FA7|nr:CHRD domain-containing protein [Agromyces sp. ISL-38]MBT2500519.1 CHRD domain-containing protein [Agromyces sp. ISL-38]